MRTGAELDGLARTRLGAGEVGDALARSAARVGDALEAAGAATGGGTARHACADAGDVLAPLLRRLSAVAGVLAVEAGRQQERFVQADRP